MNNIYGITRKDLEEYFKNIGDKPYRSTQVFDWLYKKRVNSFEQMSNLKKEIIERLNTDFKIDTLEIKKVEHDKDTYKFLFKLSDNNYVEAVLMQHDYGNSVCVSSEVGCNMGCLFCESGRLKKVRNLESYEMVLQLLEIENYLSIRISSVVVMGIGEPFDNYDNLMNFIRIINDDLGLGIGARHITVSTCGIVPKIYEFANESLQVNLALSLHAPNDEIRNKIMPINKVYSISKVIKAISDYIVKTNRRVTIEYVMLNNVNDSVNDAISLAKLLRGLNVYVNLIPYNETNTLEFKKSSKKQIDLFYTTLIKNGINVTIRKEFGGKISAACGQLRSKEAKK